MPDLQELKLPRMMTWLAVAIALIIAVAVLSPQNIPVLIYKLSLVSVAGVLGYWLDYGLFPYARPHSFALKGKDRDIAFSAAMIRRSMVMAAVMIGVTMGL